MIEPYYKARLNMSSEVDGDVKVSPIILTFLDLYHFPLRGQEQADFMAERLSELKGVCRARSESEDSAEESLSLE